jgi:hypothetical protein
VIGYLITALILAGCAVCALYPPKKPGRFATGVYLIGWSTTNCPSWPWPWVRSQPAARTAEPTSRHGYH